MASTIDANVALRYLLWDNEVQAKQAKQWIIEGACMYMEAVAEVVYVLQGVYKLSRTGSCCKTLRATSVQSTKSSELIAYIRKAARMISSS